MEKALRETKIQKQALEKEFNETKIQKELLLSSMDNLVPSCPLLSQIVCISSVVHHQICSIFLSIVIN
jgi:hypothetical protein